MGRAEAPTRRTSRPVSGRQSQVRAHLMAGQGTGGACPEDAGGALDRPCPATGAASMLDTSGRQARTANKPPPDTAVAPPRNTLTWQKSKINSATGHLRPPLITRGGEETWRRGKRYWNVPGLLRNLPVSTAGKYSDRPGSERTRVHVPG